MCGRFVQIDATITRLQAIHDFEIRADTYAPHRHHLESYNVAPQRVIVVIRNTDGELVLDEMLWGIKPKWHKGSTQLLINARSESVEQKPTFRKLLNQRIAIPAEGFYEWKRDTQGSQRNGASRLNRTPFYFYRADGNPVLMAGIFEKSVDHETGELVESFAILTTRANTMMLRYHDRMPVILEPSQLDEWLGAANANALLDQVRVPPADEILMVHQVSNRVNSSRTEGPDLIAEVQGSAPSGSIFD